MATLPNPIELRRRGLQVLVRELGFVDAMRFLHQFGVGAGDYTSERHSYLPDQSARARLEEAERMRATRAVTSREPKKTDR